MKHQEMLCGDMQCLGKYASRPQKIELVEERKKKVIPEWVMKEWYTKILSPLFGLVTPSRPVTEKCQMNVISGSIAAISAALQLW